MAMNYNGIELETPTSHVALTHSIAMDSILGKSSTENMGWTDALGNIPWGSLKDDYLQGFDNACRLFSLLHLDYQVCNGGISQYFFNGYHKERAPYNKDDVALYDIAEQKRDFKQLVKFGREIYPDRNEENAALFRACEEFQKLSFEEDSRVIETIYCDEDEYIIDEETQEEIPNPDYFESYEEVSYEDVIHGDNNFDDTFYGANDYMEELLELRAQFLCKILARDVERHVEQNPELAAELRKCLPEAAYTALDSCKKLPLASQIQSAQNKGHDSALPLGPQPKETIPGR